MGALAPVHSVHFYETHDALIDRLCGVVCSGLLIGNSVLIVCTQEHRVQLIKALERLEVDVRDYARRGRFSIFEAGEMLAMFMVDGLPDPKLFMKSVGKLLTDAKKASRSRDKALTVFGEMVAVLWEQNNRAGALALENLWNNVMQESVFHLHCAYPGWLFNGRDEAALQDICAAHSHILGLAPAV